MHIPSLILLVNRLLKRKCFPTDEHIEITYYSWDYDLPWNTILTYILLGLRC